MSQGRTYILYILAMVMLLWTGCADNAYMGDNEEATKGVNGAIAFGSSFQAITRAETGGAAAADALGGTFIVNGVKFNGSTRQDVFRDYTVNWETNSAGTTLTNTSGWDYAGINNAFADPTYEQTVKYWDWSQDSYNFIGYSVGKGNAMVVQKRPSNEIADDMTDIAAPAANQIYVAPFEYQHITQWPYFLRGSREDLCECYISDMTTVEKGNFGNEVKLKFRNLASKIRIGLYETIPGYSIKDVRFYEEPGSSIFSDHTGTILRARLLGDNGFVDKGTYKILYPTIGSSNVDNPDYNKVHVQHEVVDHADYWDFGELDYTTPEGKEPAGNHYLGRTANTATFAGNAEDLYFTMILPYEEQTQTLELRVDYTLVSTDITGETINVYGARAFLPSIYTRWRPNCAYTYIFKIADNSNGWTSPSVSTAGLYPITFDAVYLNDENGQQTTITTVAEPSITTYQKGHEYDGTNAYPLPSASTADDDDIYAQVMDVENKALKADLNTGTKSRFYKITKAKTSDPDPTEANVMDALNIFTSGASTTITGANGLTLTPGTIFNDITTIPTVTGDITVTAGQAAMVRPTEAGFYAYVYDTGAYYPVTPVYLASQPAGWPASWYTDAGGTTPATTFTEGTYYQKLKVYGVKVIKVEE